VTKGGYWVGNRTRDLKAAKWSETSYTNSK